MTEDETCVRTRLCRTCLVEAGWTPDAPANAPRAPADAPAARAGVDPGALALDLTQIALDIVGIFEPTPFADGANALISLGRGDFLGAGLSALGVIPYVGDAAKLGKLGRWAETVTNAVELAARNSEAARVLGPALRRISDALDTIPMAAFRALPDSAQQSLLRMRSALDGALPGASGGGPGSLSHMASRWDEYQARGGTWSYDRWSGTYAQNMDRARAAHRAADDYHARLGWGQREVTVQVRMPDGSMANRRLDIADVQQTRGIEHKSGYQALDENNRWEIERDRALVRDEDWSIEWVVQGTVSEPLRRALQEAGIGLRVIP
jgi:hypothetical protein